MSNQPASTIDWTAFDAVLFDLDGVLTSTARLHAAAWKRTFDEFLADRHPSSQPPFDIDSDYRAYVDGRPRFDGVATFLESRDIHLPWGDPGDAPGWDTVCAIGNSKNEMVTAILRSEGVEVYPGSLDLLDYLAPIGVALAVVSASANAAAVLRAAGIAERFRVRVDGVVAADLALAGKPAPDPFLEAARRLGVAPGRAVVVEDAVAGVEAGVAGRFGFVVGVDRHGDPESLRRAGATLVVSDLGELVP